MGPGPSSLYTLRANAGANIQAINGPISRFRGAEDGPAAHRLEVWEGLGQPESTAGLHPFTWIGLGEGD